MLILLLILLGAVSCVRQEMPSGSGSLRIVFETGALQTKAADGGEIFCSGSGTELDPYRPDLIIVVADAGGTIRGKYIGTAASNTNSQLEGTPAGTRMSVSITGLSGPATYTVYAFANTQGLWTMKCGETTVTSLASALSGVSPLITSASQIEALQFQPVAADLDNGYPKVLASRLPLSAKGTTEVKASGNGEIALPLLRCVAKVTAVFENQYGSDLMLYGYQSTFTHMNPATGYVVKHADDFLVEHDMPWMEISLIRRTLLPFPMTECTARAGMSSPAPALIPAT